MAQNRTKAFFHLICHLSESSLLTLPSMEKSIEPGGNPYGYMENITYGDTVTPQPAALTVDPRQVRPMDLYC